MDKSLKRGAATIAASKPPSQAPATATSVNSDHEGRPLPEYLRVDQAVRLFSIGRSTLYSLIANGSVTSRVIKTSRHNVSGIRLLSTESLRAFIEAQPSYVEGKKEGAA